MKQRIKDLLRERRIKQIGRRLVAVQDRDEKCRLYELFRAELPIVRRNKWREWCVDQKRLCAGRVHYETV